MVVTRFAPSPTGHLHIGVARTALFCWAYARAAQSAGRFVLRIEDTDRLRSTDASVAGILEDLTWLRLGWDDGPVNDGFGGDERDVGPWFQSQRLKIYDDYICRLIDSGMAYAAFETPEELQAKREASQNQGYKYDRAALQIPEADRKQRVEAGEAHVIRFRMPGGGLTVHDVVVGNVTFPAEELEDFIIRKRDGFPTFHMAVVVDDELMGVTHVMRGQEHLANTPKHIALQQALDFTTPVYGHLPIIFNPDGSKMSKRDKDKVVRAACRKAREDGTTIDPGSDVSSEDFDKWLKDKKRQLPPDVLRRLASQLSVALPEVDIEDFRRAGYLPEALCNFISLLGWNPKQKTADGHDLEFFDLSFLAENFVLENIGRANAKFDRAKLLSFNAHYIDGLDDSEFVNRWRAWAEQEDSQLTERLDAATMLSLAPAVKTRCKTLRDARHVVAFLLVADDDLIYDPKAVKKHILKPGSGVLQSLESALTEVSPFDAPTIDAMLEQFVAEHGLGMGKVAQPLRIAVTGSTVSPPIGTTLEIVGRESVLRRMTRCLEFVDGLATT